MKFLRQILFSILILLMIAAAGGWYVVKNYGEEIKQYVIKSLNQNLRTEIVVRNVELSFWESFPNASVLFEDVVIHAVDAKNDTLLAAQTLGAEFNLIDLYKGNYRLTGLSIRNGECKMVVDHSGRENYIFWETDSSKSSDFKIDLQSIKIENVRYNYQHYANDIAISFLVEEAEANGNFKQNIFDLFLKTTLKESHIRNGKLTLVENRTLFVYSEGSVDAKKEKITFKSANLGVDGMNFKLKGLLGYGEDSRISFDLESDNADLTKALNLLPQEQRKALKGYEISGKAKVNGSIKGPISAIDQPSFQFSFLIENGSFKHIKSGLSFSESNLSGSINNGASNKPSSTQIILENVETLFNGSLIKGKAKVRNFEQPTYEFSGDLEFDLIDAVELFEWEEVQEAEGKIKANIDLNGRLEEVGKYTLQDWKRSSISGNIQLQKVGFRYHDGPQQYRNISGNLRLENNTVKVEKLEAKVDQNDLQISGDFNNLIGYLIEENDPLFVDAKFSSPFIHLEDFLAAESDSKEEDSYRLDISPRLTIYLEVAVDSIQFKKFSAGQIRGDLVIKDEQLDARNLSFNSMKGSARGDLFIREKKNQLVTYAKVNFKNVDIKKLFHDFDNFNQESIQDNHLNGLASADIDYSCLWSKDLKVDLKSLKVESNLLIEKGVLENFKPLENLSKYIELDELRKVNFKTLQNQILIKDETVFIPKFNILSSALNLKLEGTHDFNNNINYQFELLLNEVLGKKVKKPESKFGYIEDDGLGRTKLFLKMTGNVNNPEISYDKTQLKDHINKEVEKEKNTVKQILNEEFGLFKKDSVARQRPQKKKQNTPFKIEWDEAEGDQAKQEKTSKDQETQEKKSNKKSKFGKFIDKIAQPNEEEYVEPIEN
jgi:hypothetical protein